MSRLSSPAEWVAPLTPLLSLALLPLGPLFFPTVYVIVLLVYFTMFLYTQVNHLYQFHLTSRKMRTTINKWNAISKPQKSIDDIIAPILSEGVTSARTSSQHTRERSSSPTDTQYCEMERFLPQTDSTFKYLHVFVIPNYCEPEGLLKDTIRRLAKHQHAKTNYAIILAMEESEKGHEAKGNSIRQEFKEHFVQFVITAHPTGLPNESRGKGSNVCWAVREGCKELVHTNPDGSDDSGRIMLTIMDSDAAIPEMYLQEVEETLIKVDDPYYVIMAAPIFFSRNCNEVPAAVRITDITWSAMVMSNLSNSNGVCMPCSNYTISLRLAHRVGYWDTDADSVGEDMHMWLKCFFKTNGLARTAPIYVPINLTNVQCEGYIANLYARYVQARRHFNGVGDLAYTFKKLYRATQNRSNRKDGFLDGKYTSSSLWDMWRACSVVMEAHMIPSSSGWLMFAAVPIMQFILFPPFPSMMFIEPDQNPMLTSEMFTKLWDLLRIITMLLPLPLFGTLAIYEQLHRAIDRDLLDKPVSQQRTWKSLLDYTMLPFSAWAYLTLPSTVACVKRLFVGEEEYVVGAKVFHDDEVKSLEYVRTI